VDARLTLREALGFLYHISALRRYSRIGGCCGCFCWLYCWGRYASVMAMSREPRGIGGGVIESGESGTGGTVRQQAGAAAK